MAARERGKKEKEKGKHVCACVRVYVFLRGVLSVCSHVIAPCVLPLVKFVFGALLVETDY